MGLSCACDGDYAWYAKASDNYTVLDTRIRKRCCSCKNLIEIGAICLMFSCTREPLSDVEERIYGDGDSVPMANQYMCEECADLYFSLDELGFCIPIGKESMRDLVKEYAELY